MKNTQRGFTVVEALLTVIALTLVGFTGFYVYDSNKKDDKKYAEIASNTSTQEKSLELTNAKQQEQKNLVIKELGIQIELAGPIKDVTYSMNGEQSVQFEEKSFTDLVRACNTFIEAGQPISFASMSAYPGMYDQNTSPEMPYESFIKQLPGTYLTYGNPDGGYCGETSQDKLKAVQNKYNEINVALKEAIQKGTKPE